MRIASIATASLSQYRSRTPLPSWKEGAMAEGRLTTRWRLTVEVLSPVHIGSGGPPLHADYDYALRGGEVWVLDQDRALDRLTEEQLARLGDARLSNLLGQGDWAD